MATSPIDSRPTASLLTPRAQGSSPPSAADYLRFSGNNPQLEQQAREDVLGTGGVQVAGLPNIVRWGANALKRSLDDVASGRLGGHIRTHTQRLATAPGKSVFRKPGEVPQLLNKSLGEAREAALRHGDELASGKAVGSGRTKVVQEGNRLAVTTEFGKPIGREGETALRTVVGKSGNIVTSYPVRSAAAGTFFGVLGLSADKAQAMYGRFDDRVAQTTQNLERIARRENEPNWVNELVGLLDPTGLLYAEPANQGEAAWLELRNQSQAAARDVESALGRPLSSAERAIYERRFVDAVHGAGAVGGN